MNATTQRWSAPLAALLLAAGAGAETLDEAWSIALERDLSLAAAGSRVAAAEAGVDGARAERRPEFTLGFDAIGFDDPPAFNFVAPGLALQFPLFDGSTVLMSAATVTLPLYTGGMTQSGIDAADGSLEAERHGAAALEQQVRLAVAARYIDVLRATSAEAVAAGNVASLAAHLREVEDLYRGGGVPRNDFLSASVSLADSEQRQLRTRNALDVARAAYNRALGRVLEQSFELAAELPDVDPRLANDSLDVLTAFALEARSEPRQFAAAAAALTARSTSAGAARRPQVALSGGYSRIENEVLNSDDFWTLGVGLRWNVFDGGRASNRADALALEARVLERERGDLESMIALEVRQAWLAREETGQRIAVTERALAQADENLRVVRDRYRNGEGTNSDVLDAEALRSQSLDNSNAARFDAALARYRLAYSVGLL
jgi:outer membrane protein